MISQFLLKLQLARTDGRTDGQTDIRISTLLVTLITLVYITLYLTLLVLGLTNNRYVNKTIILSLATLLREYKSNRGKSKKFEYTNDTEV